MRIIEWWRELIGNCVTCGRSLNVYVKTDDGHELKCRKCDYPQGTQFKVMKCVHHFGPWVDFPNT